MCCLPVLCLSSSKPNYMRSFSLPKPHRDHIQAIYNAHMLHSTSVDPFKLALYKLMGKLDPTKRTVPLVTATTEDWLWFQLAMACFFSVEPYRALSNLYRSTKRKMVVCVGLRMYYSTMVNAISRARPAQRELGLGCGLLYSSLVASLRE